MSIKLQLIFIAVCLTACAARTHDVTEGLTTVKLTEQEKEVILNTHNEMRRAEQASNMIKLEYSEKLADTAQKYAARCTVRHYGLGENLYASSDWKQPFNYRSIIKNDFWGEKVNYNFTKNTCRDNNYILCGHYKQVVWAQSTHVGCAATRCPFAKLRSKLRSAVGGRLFYCVYSPPAYGWRPYKLGPACSECPTGYALCEEGLCRRNTEDCSYRPLAPETPLLKGITSFKPSEKEKAQIVNFHNELRREVSASNMIKMEWSDELAAIAQCRAETCENRNFDTTFGENKQIGGNLKTSSYQNSIRGWAIIGKRSYNLKENSCHTKYRQYDPYCEYYKQMVWSRTTHVGCGNAVCPRSRGRAFGQNGHKVPITYCVYEPSPSNLKGRPYETGVACSNCPSGYTTCEKGLCSRNSNPLLEFISDVNMAGKRDELFF